jgi:hypothetical protein
MDEVNYWLAIEIGEIKTVTYQDRCSTGQNDFEFLSNGVSLTSGSGDWQKLHTQAFEHIDIAVHFDVNGMRRHGTTKYGLGKVTRRWGMSKQWGKKTES